MTKDTNKAKVHRLVIYMDREQWRKLGRLHGRRTARTEISESRGAFVRRLLDRAMAVEQSRLDRSETAEAS